MLKTRYTPSRWMTRPISSKPDTCTERAVERENMKRAYRRVVGNRGSAGVDGMGVDELNPYLQEHCGRIREELLEGRYELRPVLRVEIPTPGGKGMRKPSFYPILQDFFHGFHNSPPSFIHHQNPGKQL
jgi:retron-type reverse transcriptase